MTFFVRISTGPYDGELDYEFEALQLVEELLNAHAGNSQFKFTVIEGKKVDFEPVTVVTKYQRSTKPKT